MNKRVTLLTKDGCSALDMSCGVVHVSVRQQRNRKIHVIIVYVSEVNQTIVYITSTWLVEKNGSRNDVEYERAL